jgi:hypothetical protein
MLRHTSPAYLDQYAREVWRSIVQDER